MAGLVMAIMPKDWCCCRVIGNFGIPCLEKNREQVLKNSLIMSCAGFVLALGGFLGGYSSGAMLKAMPWVIWRMPGDTVAYAGVRWACNGTAGSEHSGWSRGNIHAVAFDEPASCTKWSAMDCSAVHDSMQCTLCKNTAQVTAVPVAIAVITYLLFANHARARSNGKDSAQHKIMAVFSAFFGGANFLGTMVTYWQSCVKSAAESDNVDASMGAGLFCMMVGATGLKFLVGFLQLGIPVEGEESDDSSEESSEDDYEMLHKERTDETDN